MFSRTENRNKKHHCMSCLQSFTTEEISNQHKKQCLLINVCQAVNYESVTIKFGNYNAKCFLKRTNSYESEHTIKCQGHLRNSIGAKLVCIDHRFTSFSITFKDKDFINKFITWVLDKLQWTQQITKQHFIKKLIMSNEDE